MPPPLDRIDREILTALEADARLSFAAIGERVGLSKTPCWKRVQGLEQAGAIRGYHADIAPAAIGLDTIAFVRLTIRFAEHREFEEAVRRHPMIVAAHATIGDYDYELRILARDTTDLDRFLRVELWQMPGVDRFVTTLAMREIKSGGAVTASAWRG